MKKSFRACIYEGRWWDRERLTPAMYSPRVPDADGVSSDRNNQYHYLISSLLLLSSIPWDFPRSAISCIVSNPLSSPGHPDSERRRVPPHVRKELLSLFSLKKTWTGPVRWSQSGLTGSIFFSNVTENIRISGPVFWRMSLTVTHNWVVQIRYGFSSVKYTFIAFLSIVALYPDLRSSIIERRSQFPNFPRELFSGSMEDRSV